jgi:hypothetical protein
VRAPILAFWWTGIELREPNGHWGHWPRTDAKLADYCGIFAPRLAHEDLYIFGDKRYIARSGFLDRTPRTTTTDFHLFELSRSEHHSTHEGLRTILSTDHVVIQSGSNPGRDHRVRCPHMAHGQSASVRASGHAARVRTGRRVHACRPDLLHISPDLRVSRSAFRHGTAY